MDKLLVALAALTIPRFVIWSSTRVKLVEWLSPVVCCYGAGILLGNVLGDGWNQETAKLVSEVSVLIALPLLLLATDLVSWLRLARSTIISFALVIVSVMTVAFAVGKWLGPDHPEAWKLAGMMVGVYTGGTPNLMAIGKALEVSQESFVILNAVDVVLGGVYLLFLMSIGVKLLARFLPPATVIDDGEELIHQGWLHLSFKRQLLHVFLLILLGAMLTGAAVFISKVLTGGESVSVIILSLTSLAVGLSFLPRVRKFEGSQEVGNYLLLVFCVAVGSLANASQLISGSGWYFLFCGLIMFGSISLHFLCCFFLKIDRDTAIITSVAGIFGPAFVAPMSQVLRNRSMLFSGVTSGLVGYAVGNFVGLLIAYLLKG